jgi:hypothetical protein
MKISELSQTVLRLTLLSIFLLFGANAIAAPSAADLQSFNDAGARLLVLIADAEAARKVDALRTPEAKNLIQRLSDEGRMLSGPPYTATNLGTILEICEVVNKASVSLLLFEAKAQIDPKANPEQVNAALMPLMKGNSLQFQNELKELQPFLLRCLAKQIPAISQFMASLQPEEITEVRRNGLARMRLGVLQVFAGAFDAVNDAQYKADYRLALLSALAETADIFVTITQLSVRKQIADAAAESARGANSPFKVYLERVSVAFRDQSCGVLCSMQ